jgi:multidrug resistance efflux pump
MTRTAINEAKLREAQLDINEARANLVKAQLFAPWDGIVTAVNASPGVATSNTLITIARVEPLRFATKNFSERNLADIQIGNQATIFLKTFEPDR